MVSWDKKGKADEMLRVVQWKVGDHTVQTLCDSGCSIIYVHSKLVAAEQLSGKYYTCLFLNGSTLQAPVAIVDVDTL